MKVDKTLRCIYDVDSCVMVVKSTRTVAGMLIFDVLKKKQEFSIPADQLVVRGNNVFLKVSANSVGRQYKESSQARTEGSRKSSKPDFYTSMASRLFGVPVDLVTDEMKEKAQQKMAFNPGDVVNSGANSSF